MSDTGNEPAEFVDDPDNDPGDESPPADDDQRPPADDDQATDGQMGASSAPR